MLQYNITVVTFKYYHNEAKYLRNKQATGYLRNFRDFYGTLSHFETDLPLEPILIYSVQILM
jgi:hypothetical protein